MREVNMKTVADLEPLEGVRTLGPLIRDHAEEAERERRVAAPVIAGMKAAGLFRLLTPRSLGGLEVDPLTFAQTIEEAGRITVPPCGRAVFRIPWRGGVIVCRSKGSRRFMQEIQTPSSRLHFTHPWRRRPPDGFRLSGRRPLETGIHDASWLMLTALVTEDGQPRLRNGSPEVIAAFMPTKDVRIIDTWDTIGMRGTDSNDVEVRELFVPVERTYPLVSILTAVRTTRGRSIDCRRWPRCHSSASPSSWASRDRRSTRCVRSRREIHPSAPRSFSGIAPPHRRTSPERKRCCARAGSCFTTRLPRIGAGGRAERLIHSSRRPMPCWWRPTPVDGAVKAVDLVFGLAGTTGIYTRNRLERHVRDVHTLRHHGFISENRYETLGQVYLGVSPEFSLVAF
jgi:hypothetical protein